jgi:flavin-dependent dehydrogenase
MVPGKSHTPLKDGDTVAIIGGGPAGSFFASAFLDIARRMALKCNIVIFDGKKFTACGPAGCNMCAGVIAETLVERLEGAGIHIPDAVVQRRIKGYRLKTRVGTVKLYNPSGTDNILTVFRGGGPFDSSYTKEVSFDNFLLDYVHKKGIEVVQDVVHNIKLPSHPLDRPVLEYGRTQQRRTIEADLVVVACGLNTSLLGKLASLGFGYVPPRVVNTCQMEVVLPRDYITEHFSDMIHIYTLGIPGIAFAAMVPKSEHVTVSVVGNRNLKKSDMWRFLFHPKVKADLPSAWKIPERYCHCHPKINLRHAISPYTDRLVIIGDANCSRLYKNGLESAFQTAYFAAESVLKFGVSRDAFKTCFYGMCRNTVVDDNYFGRLLFTINHPIASFDIVSKTHLELANNPSMTGSPSKLRWILWNMSTGNVPYRKIFKTSLDPVLQINLTARFLKNIVTLQPWRITPDVPARVCLPFGGMVGIIGGGPAGCACAIRLMQLSAQKNKDIKVILFEPSLSRENPKACAGVLSPPIEKILKDLEITIPDEMIQVAIIDYVLHSDSESIHLTKGNLEEEPTLSLNRAQFNALLINKVRQMNVRIIPSEVIDINILKDDVLIHTSSLTVRCDALVGASGLDSKMLRIFERKVPGFERPSALKSILVEHVLPQDEIDHKFGNLLHGFLPGKLGHIEFGAITPKRGHVIINIAGRHVTKYDMFGFLRLSAINQMLSGPIVREHLIEGSFPTGVAKGFHNHRAVLIGDASGLVRPYKGKGINTALITGAWAAETIMTAGISRDAFETFSAKCKDLIEDCRHGRRLRRLCWIATRTRLIDPIIHEANTDFRLYDALYSIVSGNKTYRESLHEVLRTRLILRLVKAILSRRRR